MIWVSYGLHDCSRTWERDIGLPTRSIDTYSVVQFRERSSDAENPDATGEGAYSEAETQQSHHEAGSRLAILGFADLEEDSQIGNPKYLRIKPHRNGDFNGSTRNTSSLFVAINAFDSDFGHSVAP